MLDEQSVRQAAARHGFDVQNFSKLKEIEGNAYQMRHVASNARLLYLQNEDSNKAFSISFKTPAADDTGVFHILEHSVLCGSKKFPVKEPFVNLLKSSMQTFLNAMTFPDKTMYPVASTNEQDLLNLMDVYLDAVFHPQIYQKKTIFEQEGWHFELTEGAESAEGVDRKLCVNGVVYNEMKGALSEPDSVLYDTLSAALFPDTTYAHESGGTPEGIPQLTYQQFLDNHARHYTTENSYIVLYGDMNIDRFLAFISDEYLDKLAAATAGKDSSMKPNSLDLQKPVVNMGVKKNMATSPDNSCMALGFVVGTSKQRERIMAVDVLLDAIMGSNESPMKRAILDAGIADDVHGYLSDGIAQPFAVIELKGLKPNAAARLSEIVTEQAHKLADGGLDRQLLHASLSHAEFVLREHNLGYADGVVYSIAALSGWLYDDDCALDYVCYEDAFDDLRQKIDEGYFEQLIKEVFLDNNHYASAEIVPVNADEEAKTQHELAEKLACMDSAQIAQIEAEVNELRAAQMAPDSPEDLAKLPILRIEDIAEAPQDSEFEMIDVPASSNNGAKLPVIYHDVQTNGIVYAYRYYDLSCLRFDELPYVSILASVLGKLDTANYSAADLDVAIHADLGNLNFYSEVHENIDDSAQILSKFVVSSSALVENTQIAAQLADEVIFTTDFDNVEKLHDILVQKRVAAEQALMTAGHSVAMNRVSSYYTKAGVLREQLSGVDSYVFLKDLLENFDSRKAELVEKLKDIRSRIFTPSQCIISFGGGKDALDNYIASLVEANAATASDASTGDAFEQPPVLLEIPEPVDRREALIVPTDVTYTAIGAKCDNPYNGSWLVASRALTYDYLWNEVRVMGGAYGVGFQTTVSGQSRFYSYRDPHVDETVARFNASSDWLASFNPPQREFEGYIVSSVANMDTPLKPRELIRRQDGMIFSGYTMNRRREIRSQVIATTAQDVQRLSASVSRVLEGNHVCVVGNRDIINESTLGLNKQELIAL